MNRRALVTGAALSAMLLIGGGGATTADGNHPCDAGPNGFGQHTSQMARHHGGIAAATAHHNAMHGTDLSVGEHQRMMRAGCGETTGS